MIINDRANRESAPNCLCDYGYYDTYTETSGISTDCAICDYNCLTCSDTSSYCLICAA